MVFQLRELLLVVPCSCEVELTDLSLFSTGLWVTEEDEGNDIILAE